MKKNLSAVVTLSLSSLAFGSVAGAQTPSFADRYRMQGERFQEGAAERPSAHMVSAAAGRPDRLEIPHVAFDARMAQRERGQEHGQDGASDDGAGRSHVAATVEATRQVRNDVHVAMSRMGDVQHVQDRQTQGEDAASGASHAVAAVSPSYVHARPEAAVDHPHIAMSRMGDVQHVQDRQTQGEDSASNGSRAVATSGLGSTTAPASFLHGSAPVAPSQGSAMTRLATVQRLQDRRAGEDQAMRTHQESRRHTAATPAFSRNEP